MKYLYIIVFVSLAITLYVTTQKKPSAQVALVSLPELSDRAVAGNYTILSDVPYGEDSLQAMDIYLSKKADSLGSKNYTVIFVHGGAYYMSDKKQEERYIQPYLRKGMNVINLNYRLKQGIYTATSDLALALQFLAKQNQEYGLNLEQIVLTGFSAGAHMASSIGLWYNEEEAPFKLPQEIKIRSVINFSGPTDQLQKIEDLFMNWDSTSTWDPKFMRTIAEALYPEQADYSKEELLTITEPTHQFDAEDPAFFLWYGGKDDQIPPYTHKQFLEKLNQDTVKNKVVFVETGAHSPSDEQLAAAYHEIWAFLDARE